MVNQYNLDATSVKSFYSCEESYIKCVEYGKAKAKYTSFNLLIKAILAGILVGLCGHASTVAGGAFYYHELRKIVGSALSVFLYSFTFPIALVFIVYTGSDLFTGNTLAVTAALMNKKISWLEYLRVMVISLFGNYTGTIAFAFFVSYGSGAFNNKSADVSKNHFYQFLNDVSVKKVNHSFIECLCLGIACNMCVCLAVLLVLSIRDATGVIFGIFFSIYTFAVAGFEHIIANMYTLNISLMVNTNVTFSEVYFKNFIPTFIGNCIAGICVLGIPLYLSYSEHYRRYDQVKADELQMEEIKT